MGLFRRKHCTKEETVIDMLAAALDRHNLSEIEYGRYGIKLRLAKYNSSMSSVPSIIPNTVSTSTVSNQDAISVENDLNKSVVSNDNTVNSPMVGVVYLSPNPSQPSYVKKGDKVKVGDTLCLIEAMKTFNPVKADKEGVVKEIIVKESQSVEYGEPLFIIE